MNSFGEHLTCPLCGKALTYIDAERLCRCGAGHGFDRARQGYVNLLPSHHKKSRDPGDSKEMMAARRAFLAGGHYEPVSDRLNRLLGETLAAAGPCVLDIGCGEGYYAGRLLAALGADARLWGLDISRDAVRAAAAVCKTCTWLVCSSSRIPLRSGVFDGIYSVFSPIDEGEVARLLKPEGVFIRVLPGPEHLMSLRRLIYPEVVRGPEPEPRRDGPLPCADIQTLTYEMTLDGAEAETLIRMTPHYWKTTKAHKTVLAELQAVPVTVDMRFLIYKQRSVEDQ